MNIKPTLTSDEFGETFLNSGVLNIHGGVPAEQLVYDLTVIIDYFTKNIIFVRCTNPAFFGCERVGTNTHIINPVKSARIRTAESFAFKYGKVEISAKIPTGDWLRPGMHNLESKMF